MNKQEKPDLSREKKRCEILKSFGASQKILEELLNYNKNAFERPQSISNLSLPLEPEPHIPTWKRYIEESKSQGTFKILKKYMPQLNFPIQEGMSQSEVYKQATLQGISTENIPEATGISLKNPDSIELYLHQSPAGPVPTFIFHERSAFVTFIQAIIYRNEPIKVPDSMGASMIKGYINWDRLNTYRQKWKEQDPKNNTAEMWAEHFQEVAAQKELYLDRFMFISTGPYSNTPGSALGFTNEEEWAELSAKIRIHHECTHFFTLRVLGAMFNNMLDEIIADYMGLRGGSGHFKASWFLRFLGLEDYPKYREGGRMENYCKNLSSEAFQVLQRLMVQAAKNLETFDKSFPQGPSTINEQASLLLTLTALTIEEMAEENGVHNLLEAYKEHQIK